MRWFYRLKGFGFIGFQFLQPLTNILILIKTIIAKLILDRKFNLRLVKMCKLTKYGEYTVLGFQYAEVNSTCMSVSIKVFPIRSKAFFLKT